MASDPLSAVPASDRDVRHRSLVFFHLAASLANRDDAKRRDAMAKYYGNEHGHCSSGRRDDLVGRLWATPAHTPSDHGSGGVDWCVAVLCSAPIRRHLLVQ